MCAPSRRSSMSWKMVSAAAAKCQPYMVSSTKGSAHAMLIQVTWLGSTPRGKKESAATWGEGWAGVRVGVGLG